MRIIQTRLDGGADLARLLAAAKDKPFSRQAAENLLTRLFSEAIISEREQAILKAMRRILCITSFFTPHFWDSVKSSRIKFINNKRTKRPRRSSSFFFPAISAWARPARCKPAPAAA